jgi:hypothetical protein
MGVLDYANTDVEALQQNDDSIARELDARRAYVDSTVKAGLAAE